MEGGGIKQSPLILISPASEEKGAEFYDYSVNLSQAYYQAVIAAGGLPLILPCTPDKKMVRLAVARAGGVLMTGGDDIQPGLYRKKLPKRLRKTIGRTDPPRDLLDAMLIKECFAQHKPLFAICRGHQMLNVAMGGTLCPDIPQQIPDSINHSRMEHKDRFAHGLHAEPGSILAKVFGKNRIKVNSSHHQCIDKLAPGLKVTARGPDGVIEAVELEDSKLMPYLLGVQFHPERLIYRDRRFVDLFKTFVNACKRQGPGLI